MLTFDSIRDVERAERENRKLQRLPAQWFGDLQDYMKKKRAETATNSDELMEYQNILTIIERLFDVREKKILDQALDFARTGIPAENVHEKEQILFDLLSKGMKSFRTEFFVGIKNTQQSIQVSQGLFRAKADIPEFIGPDMKTYSLKQNDVVSLPDSVAQLLLSKGFVEEVK